MNVGEIRAEVLAELGDVTPEDIGFDRKLLEAHRYIETDIFIPRLTTWVDVSPSYATEDYDMNNELIPGAKKNFITLPTDLARVGEILDYDGGGSRTRSWEKTSIKQARDLWISEDLGGYVLHGDGALLYPTEGLPETVRIYYQKKLPDLPLFTGEREDENEKSIYQLDYEDTLIMRDHPNFYIYYITYKGWIDRQEPDESGNAIGRYAAFKSAYDDNLSRKFSSKSATTLLSQGYTNARKPSLA